MMADGVSPTRTGRRNRERARFTVLSKARPPCASVQSSQSCGRSPSPVFWRLAVAATAVNGSDTGTPRAFLLVVDDLHLDFRNTPRLRKILQDLLAAAAREEDTWALVTTGISSIRVAPAPWPRRNSRRSAVITGNALNVRQQLDAFGNAERRRSDTAACLDDRHRDRPRPSRHRRAEPGRLHDPLPSPTGTTRAWCPRAETVRPRRMPAPARRDLGPRSALPDPPFDVRPDEWAAYTEAARESLRTLAEQTSGQRRLLASRARHGVRRPLAALRS